MDYAPGVQERVRKNLEFAKPLHKLEGLDRQAAQMLFSVLADLETIAVTAAERGDAIEDQLEDEQVHYLSFYTISEVLGGKLPTPPAVQGLLEFLKQARGPMSFILLNVTAESWLEVFLHGLAKANLCDGLFAEIEKDEARHAGEARKMPKPDPERAKPLMAKLERHLIEITQEADFILPLMHFVGVNTAAKLALRIIGAHKKACRWVGVDPTPDIHDAERLFKETVAHPEPIKMEMDEWQSLRAELWGEQTGMCIGRADCVWKGGMVEFERALAKAASYALHRVPELNRTIVNDQLYQCKVPLIGFRRNDSLDRVFTVYASNCHVKEDGDLKQELSEKVKMAHRQPYCSLREWRKYKGLAPPPRAAALITHIGVFKGAQGGVAVLVPSEGASLLLTTNNAEYKPERRRWLPWLVKWRRYVPVGIAFDHRTINGHHMCKFVKHVEYWFKEHYRE